MSETIVYPLSAIPILYVKDTNLRLNEETFNKLGQLSKYLFPSSDENLVNFSDNNRVLNLDCLKEARNICEYYLDKYIKDICAYKEKFIITNSWLTINKKDSLGHWPHNHPNSIFSGCLYLETGDESSSIIFHPKSILSKEFRFTYNIINNTIYNTEEFTVPVYTGSIVIFPSYLAHSVPPHTSDNTRICLCFNSFVKDKFGDRAYCSDIDLTNISTDLPKFDSNNLKYS